MKKIFFWVVASCSLVGIFQLSEVLTASIIRKISEVLAASVIGSIALLTEAVNTSETSRNLY
jgi:hypothetical protein